MYALALGFGGMQLGWAISGENQLINVIAAKLAWTEKQTMFYNSIINCSSIVGLGAGSICGGVIVNRIGRRTSLFVFNVLGILATLICCFKLDVKLIIISKLIFGFTAGVLNIAGPKLLDESLPINLVSIFGLFTNAYICLGIALGTVIGCWLPDPKDTSALEDDHFWRFAFAFPIFFCVLELLSLLCILTTDSI